MLMLGWEYPPLYAGGLGKASQGLARGLAACGADVQFVLPSYPPQCESAGLQVTGVREWLRARVHTAAATPRKRGSGLQFFKLPVRLAPYERPAPAVRAAQARRSEVTPLNVEANDRREAIYGSDLGRRVARFAQRVVRLAAKVDADVVHANDWMTFPAAFAAAEARHLPVFLHVHSTEYDRSGEAVNPFIAGIEREACRRAAQVFAVSRYTANVLASRYGVARERITVAYNAPDDDEPQALRPAPDAPRAPWVMFLGRLTFQKGPDHFLRAAAEVAKYNRDARFLVCGSGDLSADLHALARSLGIAERVEFRGFLRPALVDRLLAHSRVLVMSSVSEPFGLVALEALRDGTPVILSKQSGVREVLGHSLQVDFWDHARLADRILALLRLPALGAQLVESGRAQLERLSWQETARTLLQTYHRVCGTPLPVDF